MAAMTEVRIAACRDVPEGRGVVVEVEGKRLALFRYRERFFVLDETCPHRGGPLHEGRIEEGVVACPWHLWQFDLETGLSPVNPRSRVKSYKTRVAGGEVYVDLD